MVEFILQLEEEKRKITAEWQEILNTERLLKQRVEERLEQGMYYSLQNEIVLEIIEIVLEIHVHIVAAELRRQQCGHGSLIQSQIHYSFVIILCSASNS
jgi:hypothetical protein